MNITEVVERVRAYSGEEFSDSEISAWCKELTNNLRQNYNVETDNNINVNNGECTVCNSPYDEMYVDFCMSKIAWFQRDYDVYNELMAAFNRKLYDYAKHLRRNATETDVGKIVNWI